MFREMNTDHERETLGRVLHAWTTAFGRTPTQVREAANYCEKKTTEAGELREALLDIAPDRGGEINRRKLGHWLKRHALRIVDRLKFSKGDAVRNAECWRVGQVSDTS